MKRLPLISPRGAIASALTRVPLPPTLPSLSPADTIDDYDNVPMTREDYGMGSSSSGSSSYSSGSSLPSTAEAPRASGGMRNSVELGAPNLDHLSSNDIAAALNIGNMPLTGLNRSSESENRKFLSYERRSLWGQASYNVGYSYFGGLFLGGLAGVANGVRISPNMNPRVLLNR